MTSSSTSLSSRKRKTPTTKQEVNGDDDSGSDWTPPLTYQQNKRRRLTTNGKRKKKGRGLTQKKINEVKKCLNKHVRTLAKMVNLDWHDGYEEQGEEAQEYFQDLQEPLQLIYDYAVIEKRDYDKLNDLLKIMTDSMANIKAIPARGDLTDDMMNADALHLDIKALGGRPNTSNNNNNQSNSSSNSNRNRNTGTNNTAQHEFGCPSAVFTYMWSLFLYAAAADAEVTDAEMYRYIKDAVDNECDVLNGCLETLENYVPLPTNAAVSLSRMITRSRSSAHANDNAEEEHSDADADADADADTDEISAGANVASAVDADANKVDVVAGSAPAPAEEEKDESDKEEENDDDDESALALNTATIVSEHRYLICGTQRLQTLFANKAQWNALPTTKKVHKMRRAIDRRFDGEKHLRTRCFDSDSDDGGGYNDYLNFANPMMAMMIMAMGSRSRSNRRRR